MSIWESTNEFGITCQQHLHTKELEKLVRNDERIFTVDEDVIEECRSECW